MPFQLKRLLGYLLGFLLFYAPFSLFQRAVFYLFTGNPAALTIHNLCFRIQVEHLLDGKLYHMSPAFIACLVILLLIAFFCGPVFCGRLCPAGAVTEYLSKLLPGRWQIAWADWADIASVRYGMLLGFMLLPFFQGILACSYCNFFLFDLFFNYALFGYAVSLSSSLLLTAIIWIVVFGLFTKGGRGYCNFLCPVGALQNLLYSLSRRLPFVYKLTIDSQKCVGCGKCSALCPMDSLRMAERSPVCNVHNCILCGLCVDGCPTKAIAYGKRGKK